MQRDGEQTDAIGVLVEDHHRLRRLFDEFEALPAPAYVLKSKVAARMIDLHTVNTFLKREVLYPRLRTLVPGVEEDLDAWCAEHRAADEVAVHLWTMRPEDERFAAGVAALIERIRAHVAAQEERWFPGLAQALAPADLEVIGAELVRARRRAPASPRIGS